MSRSLAASVRFHPFRGRLRTIPEIADITGHSLTQIDAWIRTLAEAPLEDSFASCFLRRPHTGGKRPAAPIR